MAMRFNSLGIDLTPHNYSDEELSQMPIMEQLIVGNRVQNKQMLGLNAHAKSRHATPKQQITNENKSLNNANNDEDWTPDMAAEEDSYNFEMFVSTKSSTVTRKSNKSFTPPTKPGTSNSNSVNPALSAALPVTVANTPLTKSAKRRIRLTSAQTASEADKPAAPSNICINPSSHQNQSAQNKNTSASGKTTEAATPPPACVQAFTGFTAEQIETARQRSIEAQNRKEAIVRLMRAKLLNKDDLAIIEPLDRNVLQAVLKRRKREAKEQQKAEQRKKFAGRYPRRNVSRKNYHESSEDDEILDQDTNTFHCDTYKKDYEGHRMCPLHYDASGHLDQAELDNLSHGYNAMKSLPEGMLVKESPIPGAGRGVFTGQFTTLRKDMIYGPYKGVRINNEREAHQSGYCWQIYHKRKLIHWIDARQVRRSNWLRYINCAATMDQQNVCAYQVGQNIYYRTVVDIESDTELLVWYGDDYARELGQLSMAFMASINSITINGVDLACWDCQLEFRCRQLLNQHTFTAHDSVYANIVDAVGKTRCVTHRGGTRHVLGSVAKPHALVHKPPIAGSACSGLSGVVFSPGGTGSGAMSYSLREGSGGDNEGCGGTASACTTDSVVNRCQVTAGSGDAGVSLSSVQFSIVASRVVVVTDDGRRFQCSTCCKLFKTRKHLVQHTRIHTGEKPFKCTMCGHGFTHSCSLAAHSWIHTGEKPFECTKCRDRFTRCGDLTRHSRIHAGEKPFECTTCGQRFTQNTHLTAHSRIHTGEKPFGCTTCGQRFTQKSVLTRHSLKHTGEKPFECTTCGQRFTQNSGLTRHSLKHTGEKQFECTTCGQRFTQTSHLKAHSRIHWKKSVHV